MKKILLPFFLLTSFNSFATENICENLPKNEDDITTETDTCGGSCPGFVYVNDITIKFHYLDFDAPTQSERESLRNQKHSFYSKKGFSVSNGVSLGHCFSGSYYEDKSFCTGNDGIALTVTSIFQSNETSEQWLENEKDQCKGFCAKNTGSTGDPVKTESYPSSNDIDNGYITISNGNYSTCNNSDDPNHEESCVLKTAVQNSFDGQKITTISQSFITENQCSGEDDSQDLEYEQISLQYCNESGGYYGNNYCDSTSNPDDYYCPSGDCSIDPDPTPDPDPDGSGGDGSGSGGDGSGSGGDGSGSGGDGSGSGGDGSGSGGDGSGSGGDGSGSGSGSGAETEEGVIAYLEGLYDNFTKGNVTSQNEIGNDLIQNKNDFNSKSTEIDLSTYDFDETGFISNDTCPLPYQMTLPWGTFEIPFDSLCQLAELLSYLVLSLAYFIAGRTIVKGV